MILAELLLRGPQTLGELRGRASRMHPLESIDRVKDMIRALSDRPEPYVKELPPSPGSRAERYVQLLCADLHEVGEVVAATPVVHQAGAPQAAAPQSDVLAARVTQLEAQVQSLRGLLIKLARAVGEEPIAAEANAMDSAAV